MADEPTDDELAKIQAAGEQREMDRDQYANNAEIDNAGRRALYKAGESAGLNARAIAEGAFLKSAKDWRERIDRIRGHDAARLVADRTGAPMDAVESALAELHERITEEAGRG